MWACISVKAFVHHPLVVQAQTEAHSLGSSGDSTAAKVFCLYDEVGLRIMKDDMGEILGAGQLSVR